MSKVVSIDGRRHAPAASADCCVVGLGATGLPLVARLAQRGCTVAAVDGDAVRLAALEGGRYHQIDPGLAQALAQAARSERLTIHPKPVAAKTFLVTRRVDPAGDAGLGADLHRLEDAIDQIAPLLRGAELLVLETSGPLGMTRGVRERLEDLRPDLTFDGAEGSIAIGYSVERARPGQGFDAVGEPRIVGGVSPAAGERVAAFYRDTLGVEVQATDCRTAEMVKLAENAFRDVNIAFANELAMVCDHLGLNVWDSIGIANHHPRVNILFPSAGVGGHSVASDPAFLIAAAPERARLIKIARAVNLSKTDWAVDRIKMEAERLGAKRLALVGLSAKPNAAVFTESPALEIAHRLSAAGRWSVVCADPYLDMAPTTKGLETVEVESAVQGADLVVYLVAHAALVDLPCGQGRPTLDLCGVLGSETYGRLG